MRRFLGFLGMAVLVSQALAQQKLEYFPLKAGVAKHYLATRSQSTLIDGKRTENGNLSAKSEILEEMAGTSRALGKEAFLVRATRKDSVSGGPKGAQNVASKTESYYQVKPDGIFLLANIRDYLSSGPRPESTHFEPPLQVIKLPVVFGKGWKVGPMKFQGVTVNPEAIVEGNEDVTVPAGTFKNCLKVKTFTNDVRGTFQGIGGVVMQVAGGKLLTTSWYAPGVGLVKQEALTQFLLAAPNRPELKAEIVFNQAQQLTKIEGLESGKEAKKTVGAK